MGHEPRHADCSTCEAAARAASYTVTTVAAPPHVGTQPWFYRVVQGDIHVMGSWPDRAIAEDVAEMLNRARARRQSRPLPTERAL